MKRAAGVILFIVVTLMLPYHASAQVGPGPGPEPLASITDLPGNEHVPLCSNSLQWTIDAGSSTSLNLSHAIYTVTPLNDSATITINGSAQNAYPTLNFWGDQASQITNTSGGDNAVWIYVRLCRQSELATATPTSDVPSGCMDLTLQPIPLYNNGSQIAMRNTVDFVGTPWESMARDGSDFTIEQNYGTDGRLTYLYLPGPGMTIQQISGSIQYTAPAGAAGSWAYMGSATIAIPESAIWVGFSGGSGDVLRICGGMAATPTPNPTASTIPVTRTATPTSTATATATATNTPTMTITPTPPLNLPCPVADSIGVPVAPGTASVPLRVGTRFVVTGANVWFNIGTEAREIYIGAYEWNLEAGNYTVYSLTAPATIWICVGTGSDGPTALPTALPTWTPGVGGIAPPVCIVVETPTQPNAYTLPDLSLDLPTLRPLGSPTVTGTIGTATPAISTTAILNLFSTIEAGIATPEASLRTATANYSWQTGSLLAATSAAIAQPALSWLSILNPNSPSWTSEGGPLWALAPAVVPVIPILIVALLVIFARYMLWLIGWLLKGADIVIKLIELIPGE